MSEIPIKLSYMHVIAWIIVVALFAGFVFTVAFIQLNVKFSDKEVTEKKRDRISSEVFGNLPAFIVFVGIILVFALVGSILYIGGKAETTVSSAPGELV